MPRHLPPLLILLHAAFATACSMPSDTERAGATPGTGTTVPTRSLNSDAPALMTFVNRSNEPLNIYWLDFGGNRQLYKTLEAGGSYAQQTYLTHPWLVTDARGRTWNVYLPEAQPRTVYLQTPAAAVIAR